MCRGRNCFSTNQKNSGVDSDFDSIHILLATRNFPEGSNYCTINDKDSNTVSIFLVICEIICTEILVIGNCRSIEHLNAA